MPKKKTEKGTDASVTPKPKRKRRTKKEMEEARRLEREQKESAIKAEKKTQAKEEFNEDDDDDGQNYTTIELGEGVILEAYNVGFALYEQKTSKAGKPYKSFISYHGKASQALSSLLNDRSRTLGMLTLEQFLNEFARIERELVDLVKDYFKEKAKTEIPYSIKSTPFKRTKKIEPQTTTKPKKRGRPKKNSK